MIRPILFIDGEIVPYFAHTEKEKRLASRFSPIAAR
jgi:hypothetical protein